MPRGPSAVNFCQLPTDRLILRRGVSDDLSNVDLGDQIRLRAAFSGLPAGSEGVVFGFYRHPDEPAIAVRFGDVRLTVPLELCEIVGAASLRQSG